MPLDERKLIARRAAMELPANGVVNLGIGMPEGVASVANEEKILSYITLTAEPGVIGGVPASGLNFGAAVNTDAIIDQNQQFDFYDGGGLDLAVLGMAECDAEGNVNVSRFGAQARRRRRLHQHQPERARGGLHRHLHRRRARRSRSRTAGCASCRRAGRSKFVAAVEQITFNGAYAAERGQPVLYVTERCVFRRTPRGPGADRGGAGHRHRARHPGAHGLSARSSTRPELMDRRIFQPTLRWASTGLCSTSISSAAISFDRRRATPCSSISRACGCARPRTSTISRSAVEGRCRDIGHRVPVVVNYDHFRIDPELVDAYAAMVRHMEDDLLHRGHPLHRQRLPARSSSATRWSGPGVKPHLFETAGLDRSGGCGADSFRRTKFDRFSRAIRRT